MFYVAAVPHAAYPLPPRCGRRVCTGSYVDVGAGVVLGTDLAWFDHARTIRVGLVVVVIALVAFFNLHGSSRTS